jgi:outer membrane protein assembly factor BamE
MANFRIIPAIFMLMKIRLLVLMSFVALSACSSNGDIKIPGLYRLDIQQGNVVDQAMIDRLKPGMDRNQVQFILGTPAVADPFHADQWEYFFSMSEGGDTPSQRSIRVHFVEDKLGWLDGDVASTGRVPVDTLRQTRTVEVPLREQEGWFERIINSLPLIGDGRPRPPPVRPKDDD